MRRVLLVLIVLLIVVAAAAGGAMLYVNSRLGGRQVLHFVNGMVLERAGLRLDWSRARGTFLFNLVVDNPVMTVASGDTLLTARSLRVRFDLWSLLEGNVRLRRVELDAPCFEVTALAGIGRPGPAEGRAAIEREAEPAVAQAEPDSTTRGGGTPLVIDRVVLRDGTVLIGPPGLVREVAGIQFRGSMRLSAGGGVEVVGEHLRGVLNDWGLEIEELTGRIVVNAGRLWLIGVKARTPGSRLAANGALWLGEETPAGLRLDLQADRLEEWWPVLGGSWAGPGPLRLRGRLSDHPWNPRFEVIGEGMLAGLDLGRAVLKGNYADELVTVALEAAAPSVDRLEAHLRLQTATGAAEFEAAADSLRLPLTPALLPLRAENLRLEGWTTGYDPLQEGSRLLLQASGLEGWGLNADSLAADLATSAGRIQLQIPIRLIGPGYRLFTTGTVNLDGDQLDLVVRGGTEEPSAPAALAGLVLDQGRSTLNLAVTGRIIDPDLRGELFVNGLRRQQLAVAGTSFRFGVQRIVGERIGTFTADLDSLRIGPAFELPVASLNGRIAGERVTVEQLRGSWPDGEAFLQGNIVAHRDSIEARFGESYLDHREIAVRGLGGSITLYPVSGVARFELTGRAADGTARVEGARDSSGTLNVHGEFDDLDMGPFARSLRWPGEPSGVFSGVLDTRIGTHVEQLQARLQVREPAWSGQRYRLLEVEGNYQEGIVEVERMQLTGEGPERVEAAGQLHLPGATARGAEGLLQLDATITALALAPFGHYLEGHLLTGTGNGTLTARGTFAQPRLNGDLRLIEARFDSLTAREVRSQVRYDGSRLSVSGGRLEMDGFSARFEAGLPFVFSLDPFTARIDSTGALSGLLTAEGQPAALVLPFTDQVERLEGTVNATVRLGGTVAEPDLNGSVTMRQGRLKPAFLGQTVQELELEVVLERDRAHIVRLAGRLPSELPAPRSLFSLLASPVRWVWQLVAGKPKPKGDFLASGEVVLGEGGRPEINVTVKGNTLGLSDPTGSLALVADLDLALDTRPTAERPGLTGKVGVQQGIVDVGFITQLTGSETNAEVEKPRGGGGIPLNVDVSIPGGLRVIGEDITLDENLNVELRGDLIVRMDPPGPLYLLGSLETVTGRDVVYAYNRRWSIDRGTFTFGTIEEINPNLDVELNAQIDEDTQVTLTLGGTMREPTTLWSSDNPNLQSQGDILLLVLPFNPTLGVQTAMATQWATRYVESAVSRQAGQWLGVDTFEIQGLLAGSSGQNTQISVGKFVGSQYYVRTSLDVGGTGTASQFGLGDVGVEYRLNRNFRLSASRDFRLRIYLLELKWRIDY
jgi:hypothetical protein